MKIVHTVRHILNLKRSVGRVSRILLIYKLHPHKRDTFRNVALSCCEKLLHIPVLLPIEDQACITSFKILQEPEQLGNVAVGKSSQEIDFVSKRLKEVGRVSPRRQREGNLVPRHDKNPYF